MFCTFVNMNGIDIRRYSFNSASNNSIEVKSLDFLWDKAEQTTVAHRAEFYHLVWVEQGKLEVSVDFEQLRLRDAEAILITPGQVCLFSLEHRPMAYSVLFVPEFLGEASSDRQLLWEVSGATPLKSRIISLEGLPIGGLMHQLIGELTHPDDVYQRVIARSCLRILLAEIARRVPRQRGESSHLAERFFDEVERCHHRLSNVQDYLRLLSVQEKPLAQAVRQAIGLSPKAYIDQRRMLEARRLLAHSSVSSKEVAYALGFDEPTNFNKFFRKHCGLSPMEFRQSLAASGETSSLEG